jgi:hypothetical protein
MSNVISRCAKKWASSVICTPGMSGPSGRLFDAQTTAAHEPHAQSRTANGAVGVRIDPAIRHEPNLLVRSEHEALAGVPPVVCKLDAL